MTPEEAKFLLEKDPATGANVAYMALRHNQPMWRVMFDAGLPEAIRGNSGARRDLLERLIHVPEKDNARVVLNGILDDMKKPQLQKLMCNVRSGEVLVATWLRNCTAYQAEPGGQHSKARFTGAEMGLDDLLECLSSRGLTVNPEYRGKGRHGRSYEASPLQEICSSFLHKSGYENYVVPATDALFRRGAKLDAASRKTILKCTSPQKVLQFVTLMDDAGLIGLNEWLESPGDEAKQENIALIQAGIAQKQIASIKLKQKPTPS